MEFYISPQSGQFYMINVLENQWLSVTNQLALDYCYEWFLILTLDGALITVSVDHRSVC